MTLEQQSSFHLEIGHVLFIDIIGYSKLLITEQSELLRKLTDIVRETAQFRAADAEDKLVRLPTGDGMALVFRNSPGAPVQCALELGERLRSHPELQVRMGIHSGPVNEVRDVNDRINITGAGINIAQRVMDCGDAGHILLSKRVADDLEQYPQWRSWLHDLGECEVKHGVRLAVVNLYTETVGNSESPQKFKTAQIDGGKPTRSRLGTAAILVAILAFVAFGIVALIFTPAILKSRENGRHRNSILPDEKFAAALFEKSIAVLPFENLSRDPENAFFADGVQDQILTDLAKVADLKVISRTSVMEYKSGVARKLREIAQQLGVSHLLEGSVQRAANRVRVNAQLIDARNDAHVWAQTYDRDLADVFAIQSEIAKAIAEQLQAKLSPTEQLALDKPPTSDLAAYDLYLRAVALYADSSDVVQSKVKLPKAADLLKEATERDPKFLLAFCLLAKVQTTIYWQGFDHTPARLDLANAAVQSALRLQPDSGEAHLALADYYYRAFRDYGKALVELNLARRTLPNNADVYAYTGYIDRRQGRWEEAIRNLERALELDPRNFLLLQQLAITYEVMHRYADEARIYDRALLIMPGDPVTRMARSQIVLNERGDLKPALEMQARLIAEDPSIAPDLDDPWSALMERTDAAAARALKNYPADGTVLHGVVYPKGYWEGAVALWQKDSPKAQAAFTAARAEVEKTLQEQPDSPGALSLLGMIDAGLGRKEDAIREGRRACELLPISKDALDGSTLAINLAQIYVWLGEKDLAIEQIAAVERVPNVLSYGDLKLHPFWDPLRGDSRFEKIVQSLAPKG